MPTNCIKFSNNDAILVARTFERRQRIASAVTFVEFRLTLPTFVAMSHRANRFPRWQDCPATRTQAGDGDHRADSIQRLFWKPVSDGPGIARPYIHRVILLKGTFDGHGVPSLIPYPRISQRLAASADMADVEELISAANEINGSQYARYNTFSGIFR